MNRPEIQAAVIEEIATFSGFPENKISPESDLAEMGLDSIDVIELEMALEERFGQTFEQDVSDRLSMTKTVKGWVDILEIELA